MNKGKDVKYLVVNDVDRSWGLVVNTVGKHDIKAGYDSYPPKLHPMSFYFEPERGRILDSWQLLYITDGAGTFYTDKGERIPITAGDMILLRPDQWHSYMPDMNTGWKEYWIGFSGDSVSPWVNSSVFNREMTVFKVGIHEDIIDLYERAIDTAAREKVSYQQCLAGIVSMLFALMVYRNRNLHVPDSETANAINRAKAIIRENFYDDMSLEEIARQVNMSYTWFRKQFKAFTGMSPAHYIQELKLQHSKKLLASTDMSIKEISFTLGYDAPSHFTNIFKKHIGCSPLAYRANCRGNLLKPTGGGIIIRKKDIFLAVPTTYRQAA